MIFKKFNYKKINSTNEIAIKKIKKKFIKGIVVAEEQKKGKGQYGRKWISQKGNLFISIFFRINNNIPRQSSIPNPAVFQPPRRTNPI